MECSWSALPRRNPTTAGRCSAPTNPSLPVDPGKQRENKLYISSHWFEYMIPYFNV
jgi:hypothetical protein